LFDAIYDRNVWQPQAVFQPLFSSAASFVIFQVGLIANQSAAASTTLINGACHAATATQSSNSKLKNKQLEAQAEAACMHHAERSRSTWRANSADTSRTTATVIPVSVLVSNPRNFKIHVTSSIFSKQSAVPVDPRNVSPSLAMLCSIQILRQTQAISNESLVGSFEPNMLKQTTRQRINQVNRQSFMQSH